MANNDTQSFPDAAATALLVIDVINDLEFDAGEALLEHALPMADSLAALKRRAKRANVPTVYLNDNFGQWRSDFRGVVSQNLNADVRGRPLVEKLAPEEDDYFVLKPKHSGFFGTTLETLLRFLGVRRLILTGLTTDMCVLFTAMDAYMRDFELCIPVDCSACSLAERHAAAIRYAEQVLKAEVSAASELRLQAER